MAASSSNPHNHQQLQYYSDYSFSSCSTEENSSMFYNIAAINYMGMHHQPLMSSTYDQINSPVSVASFPEQFGIFDTMVVPKLSDRQYDYVFDQPTNYAMTTHNWGNIQGKPLTKNEEETEVKVGRYSVEERKERILRYLKKRNQRNFNKTIKYACRKTLADKRVRVRGRFAKNNELINNSGEDESLATNSSDCSAQENIINSLYDHSFQMKFEEDDWLEAAMANLVHLPYLGS